MTSLMLGDNPFFAISHHGPAKTQQYLQDDALFSKAQDVIRLAGELEIGDFMVSSHAETQGLLKAAGYLSGSANAALPKLVVNIPNVHKMNNEATQNGVISGLLNTATEGGKLWGMVKSLAQLRQGVSQFGARMAVQSMISQYPADHIGHVCIHNIFTDLLLGIGKPYVFEVLTDAIESLGYKPAFISMNPIIADRLLPSGVPLCIYYNRNGFNMCPNRDEVLGFVRSTTRPLWAMGVLASGAIPVEDAFADPDLARFSRIIYATTSVDRLRHAAGLWHDLYGNTYSEA